MPTEEQLLLEERALLMERASLAAPAEKPFTPTMYQPFRNTPSPGEVYDAFGSHVAEPSNRTQLGILDLPVTMVNLGIQALYSLDKIVSEKIGGITDARSESAPQLVAPFTEAGRRLGGVAQPGQEKHGLVPEIASFVGGNALPFAGIMGHGFKVLASPEISAVPSILSNMGRVVATNPIKATAFDVAANVTAAAGGEVARKYTDDQSVIAMSQLGAAFIPTAVAILPGLAAKFTMTGKAADKVLEVLGPYSEAGAKVGASNRVQDVVADPTLAASKIDPESALPVALQTEDPGLIKLQELIFKRHPAISKKYSDELKLVIEQLAKDGSFGGDSQRARHLLNIVSQRAVEEASIALTKLTPNLSPRQISSIMRGHVQKALDDSVRIEKTLWESLDSKAPGTIDTARNKYGEILAKRSDKADPKDIPAWVAKEFGEDAAKSSVMRSLDKDGWIGIDGEVNPALLSALEKEGIATTEQYTFNSIKDLRSRLGAAITKERGKVGYSRNKVRILSEISDSLLDDLVATNVVGAQEARAFSAALNNRYRKGLVGRLLGYDVTGAERVAGEDLLNDVVLGRHAATNSQKLSEMSNQAPGEVLDFLRAKYVQSVYKSNLTNPSRQINIDAHKKFVENLRNEGMFEVFPEFEVELHAMRTKGLEALKLDVPDAQIGASTLLESRSRAALLLQAKPSEEMAAILDSAQPVLTARSVMKRMVTAEWPRSVPDPAARQGLKTSFFQEILRRSSTTVDIEGHIVPNGKKALALLDDFKEVLPALHFTEAEKGRAIFLADQIRIAQLSSAGAGDIGTTVMAGGLSKPIELVARVLGARLGGQLGKSSAGGSIQMASIFSREGRDRILNLTTSQAEELVIAAFDDPVLMRSLLLGPRAGAIAQQRAFKVIENAIRQSEIQGATTLAIAGAFDNDEEQ